MPYWKIIAGVFLGWGLGANDAANIFGTAVSSQMLRWRTAALLLSVFVLAGAVLQGAGGLETYSSLAQSVDLDAAFFAALAAALTVAGMSTLSLPVSTSQAVVGGILGISFARIAQGRAAADQIDLQSLGKVVACWVGTPIGAALLAAILYALLARLFRRLHLHFLDYDSCMRWLLILAGVYGAYALGANNVANVTGVFYGAGLFGAPQSDTATRLALLVGGASIAFGALTYSKRVMLTVGASITRLDAFSAFIVVLAEAVTVHIYAEVGVPVSTSQAVVGAVLGIGLLKGMRAVRFSAVALILGGWLLTPAVALGLAYLFCRLGG